MDQDRLKHSLSVARKMVNIAKEMELTLEQQKACFVIGYNHDIGYEFTDKPIEHNKVGGEILKSMNFEYWKEIYYHGEIDKDYDSIYLTILNKADMQIDKFGNDVGYDKRLEDIKSRYGEQSEIYKKSYKLIEKIRK